MSTRKWTVEFTNGTSITQGNSSANKEQIWALQLEWLIRRHFENRLRLRPQGIKNLSLIFIDRVANYMSTTNPVIKNIFEEQFTKVYAEFHNGVSPSKEQIKAVQDSTLPKPHKENTRIMREPIKTIRTFTTRYCITSNCYCRSIVL